MVGGFVDVGVERHGRDQVRGDDGDNDTGDAGEEGQDEAFQQELGEDVAAAGAEGFHDADFAGSLGDGDQHDVHDADAADGEGHGADDAEKDLKSDGEGYDAFGIFDGVPGVDGFFVAGIEVVALGEDGTDSLDGLQMHGGC